MIKAICGKCGHVFWAIVIMGLTGCPKCSSDPTFVAILEQGDEGKK